MTRLAMVQMDATKAVLRAAQSKAEAAAKDEPRPSGSTPLHASLDGPKCCGASRGGGKLAIVASSDDELCSAAAKAIARQERREAAMRARGIEPAKKQGEEAVSVFVCIPR